VGTESLDNVTGILQAKDLLPASLAGKPLDLKTLIQQPLFVPRTISALALLESFKKSGKHIALVVDGGGHRGLANASYSEAIAGDAFQCKRSDPMAVQRHDGLALDGMLTVDEFSDLSREAACGKRDAYQTLGGFGSHRWVEFLLYPMF
jgi:putative hemolysin